MAEPAHSLTDRQRSVMQRIDRRVPIKVIAQDMGISETRINQHIRALKDIYQAENLNQLVELYRQAERPSQPEQESELFDDFTESHARTGENAIAMNATELSQGYWSARQAMPEQQTVTGFLDNENALWNRLGVIVSILSLLLSFTVLSSTGTKFIFLALG